MKHIISIITACCLTLNLSAQEKTLEFLVGGSMLDFQAGRSDALDNFYSPTPHEAVSWGRSSAFALGGSYYRTLHTDITYGEIDFGVNMTSESLNMGHLRYLFVPIGIGVKYKIPFLSNVLYVSPSIQWTVMSVKSSIDDYSAMSNRSGLGIDMGLIVKNLVLNISYDYYGPFRFHEPVRTNIYRKIESVSIKIGYSFSKKQKYIPKLLGMKYSNQTCFPINRGEQVFS